ncbi:MAG TPA: S53 family serine peptidase [Candidatus Aquilonibacter sp.]|nr:S53 family serine peptidase [Candidatus Aquilonibacter sp.]
MKQRSGVLILAVVFGVAVCLAISALAQDDAQLLPTLTHHVREATLNGQARLVGRLPATRSMRLVFVLPLRNQAELDSVLRELYDPFSPSYRQFLTVEEFTSRFGPTQQDYESVISFARANGLAVVGISRNRLNVDVEGTVANIEKALHVTMGLYQHPTENRTFYAPDREPTLALQVPLWHIAGLDNYSIPHPLVVRRDQALRVKSNATTGSCPQKSFCGSDMRAAYYGGTALTGSGQSLGLLEYYGTDLTDLNTYYSNAKQTLTVPITLRSVDGTSTSCLARQGCDDTEQTLDMTQALGMAPGLSSLVMYVGSSDAAIFNAMATASPLDAQLSSSWGWSPADPKTDNPYFEEFSAQGQNLFDASGDDGRWGGNTPYVWPADAQYLVSVGGTDLTTNGAGGPWATETAWVDGGGGVSPHKYAIPSWQVATAAVCSECSQNYRNGPDVSANANFTFYVCADQAACTANGYGGTSFAAPMWAGFLALVNQQAVQNGQSTLGFIDPALYTIGLSSGYDSDFHDIISGSNGYNAVTGFDLATGWGSPNGVDLINALTETVTMPDFTIGVSPSAITIKRGNTGSTTLTTTISGGFNAAIALSASINVVTFTPSSIAAPGAGTSQLQVRVGPNVVLGDHTLTITGKGGGITHTTTITVDVTN